MSDLPGFLLARIAEDEEVAGRAEWFLVDFNTATNGQFGDRFSPAHVLAECGAKRRMLALLDEYSGTPPHVPRLTIYTREVIPKILALAYSDHPDYREEWRP